ncbi:hypothetical protein [Desulfitobacterium sp. AusDCA]|uniref:hypothetical protein n=1 Tax=Desulfitobacterium sp. AusDCA TaxID=3240383 RepID=UPI003DA73718
MLLAHNKEFRLENCWGGFILSTVEIINASYEDCHQAIEKVFQLFPLGNPYNFAEALVEVFAFRVPDLVIVDGILAMEGNGLA